MKFFLTQENKKMKLSLAPFESVLFIFGDTNSESYPEKKEFSNAEKADLCFKVEIAEAGNMEDFKVFAENMENSKPINITSINNLPDFSGVIRYTSKFKASDIKDINNVVLDLVDVGNTAEVYLNGE